MAVRSYGPDTDFGYMCTVIMFLEKWPWSRTFITLKHGQQKCKTLSRSNMARAMTMTLSLTICSQWTWSSRYHLGAIFLQILGSCTTIVYNIIKIEQGSKKLWSIHDLNRQTDKQKDWNTAFVCGVSPCPSKYELCSRSWHTVWSWATVVYNV